MNIFVLIVIYCTVSYKYQQVYFKTCQIHNINFAFIQFVSHPSHSALLTLFILTLLTNSANLNKVVIFLSFEFHHNKSWLVQKLCSSVDFSCICISDCLLSHEAWEKHVVPDKDWLAHCWSVSSDLMSGLVSCFRSAQLNQPYGGS